MGRECVKETLSERQKVERYYETLIGQGSAGLSPDIVTYLLLFIGMMLLFIPVQEMMEEGILFSIVWVYTLLITMAVTFYMQKYHVVTFGNNKMENVAEKLFYMPIDRKENRRFLFRKLIGFLKKLTIAGLIMQLGVALIAYHSLSIWNIIYILVLTFIAPLAFCGAPILLRDIMPRK
ncbi:MAG: hypothetical protein E7289_09115 [Lachnospiraceae bacterium]|nr:hypothetical protein [Lachnospiraceae bacterium]